MKKVWITRGTGRYSKKVEIWATKPIRKEHLSFLGGWKVIWFKHPLEYRIPVSECLVRFFAILYGYTPEAGSCIKRELQLNGNFPEIEKIET